MACHGAEDKPIPEMAQEETEPAVQTEVRKVPSPASGKTELEARWIAVSVSSHLTWGLHPVAVRYVQVFAGLEGLVFVSAAFIVSLFLMQGCLCSGLGGWQGLRVGLPYSLVTLGRIATETLSAKYARVLYVQLLTQLGPFVTAFMSRILLGEKLPKYFCSAVTICTIGAFMTIMGQAGPSADGLSQNDIIGIGFSIVSVFFSAGMRIYMKVSSGKLTPEVLMSWQYTNAFPMLGIAYLCNDVSIWSRWLALTPRDVGFILVFTFVISLFANFSQVASVRRLGPSLAASIQPMRLVSTVLGGYIALGEPIESKLAWTGLVVIFVTLVTFLQAQFRPTAHPSGSQTAQAKVMKVKAAPEGQPTKNTKYGRLPEP